MMWLQYPISLVQAEVYAERPFVYGFRLDTHSPWNIDPHLAFDHQSHNFIDQICEGLFSYDLTSPNMAIQPQLAKNFGKWQEKEDGFYGNQWTYTVELKNNIKFHDNTPFDAYDVEFSFNRLRYFCQQEPSTLLNKFNQPIYTQRSETPLKEIYQPLKNLYPATPYLINTTKALNETYIEFTLNYQYIPLEALLCFSGSYILSNSVDSTPKQKYYNSSTDILVGTGPYFHVSSSSSQLNLKFYKDYYQNDVPDIKEIHWTFYDEIELMNEEILEGKIDFIKNIDLNFIEQFLESNYHYRGKKIPGTAIFYLGFDCNKIDINTRKAMQNAINYTYVVEDLGQNQMTSKIPKGIRYHDEAILEPKMNLTAARLYMIQAIETGEQGLSKPSNWEFLKKSDDDEDWEAITIVTYNYSYFIGRGIRESVLELAKLNFKKIGIKIDINQWYSEGFGDIETDIFMSGWNANYNDPSIYINPLLSNTSISNLAHVNDSILQNLMIEGINEENLTKRQELYYEMQQYIIDLAPWAFLYTSYTQHIFYSGCNDTAQNPMGKLYFYLWEFDYSTIPSRIPSFPIIGILSIMSITISLLLNKQFKSMNVEQITKNCGK